VEEDEGTEEEVIKSRPKTRKVLRVGGGPFKLPQLPSPGEIKDTVEQIIEGVSQIKEIPKSLVDHLADADEDFRGADRLFRGTRLRGGRKK